MNEITKQVITISFYVWQPQQKKVQEEIDHLTNLIRERTLLAHCGHVKLVSGEPVRI